MLTLILLVTGALAAIVAIATARKTKWGINFDPPKACAACGGAFAKRTRMPADLGETLWGGRTCGACGTRFDKWGRTIGQRA